jgi:RNA polymerase sigma-70 factor, ECF subfamily
MADVARDPIEAHYVEVLRFVRRRVDSDGTAEDVTQQVFLEAAVALGRRADGSALGLLYTIARRRLVDRLRATGREPVALDEADAVAAPSDYGPAVARLIREALERLEPAQRRLVALRLLRGLSFSETAAAIGISEGACKMRFRAALDVLRAELEREGVGP